MIGTGILLVLTFSITVGWLYVELTDVSGQIDRETEARDQRDAEV